MRKYESDIREHISVEQQLKIYIDNMKYKNECEIKECKIELDDTIAHFNKVIKQKDLDISQMKNEIETVKA